MRILILSFYYSPDLSAGSFRTTALVQALRNINGDDIELDVVTTLPNRYQTFSSDAPEDEKIMNTKIHRIRLPSHKSGMFDQSKAFIEYFHKVNTYVAGQDYDLVFATSSRLMTATLGAWIAWRKNINLYLDIRDIFVDTIKDVLSKKIAFFARPMFSLLERWTIKRATKVNLVSEGFRSYFEDRYSGHDLSFFTNGIDLEFLNARKRIKHQQGNNRPIKVLYAGNMGEGQGLHCIVPKLAEKMEGVANFILIGDGGRKEALQTKLDGKCINVEIRPPINRNNLINEYLDADVLFLHLNDYPAFRKVLPSKLFEYAALGKPIWAGVSGYAAEFIKNEIVNAAVFTPCDHNEAIKSFETLKLVDMDRADFNDKYARDNIMKLLAHDVLSVCKRG